MAPWRATLIFPLIYCCSEGGFNVFATFHISFAQIPAAGHQL